MELYRIWYKTENGCLPKLILNTNPREAQKQFLQENHNAEILECEHIGKRVNTKCKVIKREWL